MSPQPNAPTASGPGPFCSTAPTRVTVTAHQPPNRLERFTATGGGYLLSML